MLALQHCSKAAGAVRRPGAGSRPSLTGTRAQLNAAYCGYLPGATRIVVAARVVWAEQGEAQHLATFDLALVSSVGVSPVLPQSAQLALADVSCRRNPARPWMLGFQPSAQPTLAELWPALPGLYRIPAFTWPVVYRVARSLALLTPDSAAAEANGRSFYVEHGICHTIIPVYYTEVPGIVPPSGCRRHPRASPISKIGGFAPKEGCKPMNLRIEVSGKPAAFFPLPEK